MQKAVKTFLFFVCMLFCMPSVAQVNSQETDNTFGGWEFFEVYHSFKNPRYFTSFYFEHANYQYKRLECWFARLSVGYKFNSWLKADVAYDFMQEPGYITHRAVADLIGTLKQGDLTVSVRERYIHSWSPKVDEQGRVVRSRLKVQYAIPDTRFNPYLAVEVFTWNVWKKTRYYLGTTYNINKNFAIEGYYLYYTFAGKPSEHVLGIGLNIEI